MHRLVSAHNWVFDHIARLDNWIIPTLCRFTFAAVLLMYFWASAWTKLGSGLLGFIFPGSGAYVQMFPKAMEAVSYDSSQLGFQYYLVALVGTWAEFILPFLIVVGLFTRLASIGMIVFVLVQTWVDINGHNAQAATIGAWFDKDSGSLIMDQRLLWITVLIVLIVKGAGPLSADRVLKLS
ncbi:DoxX family protein [Chachezhania antarctica]|uniref:DoxX family protein n=1 Tax=Chachezhania antarctica TaxID=2340860 RepID=UPI000EB08D0E|nr:DoxX family protein [Chachezhania antarctica]|tara:strand:- start:3023 stop:3565 length:543 start_codon:yes stop_codon:yes gene_type:complete